MLDREKFGALSGLVATIGFLALYATAMLLNPDHRIGVDHLSNLGVETSGGHPQNPWPFNIACIVAGIFAFPFAWLGLRPALPVGRARDPGIVVFNIASAFLVQVGIFNEDYKGIHSLVAAVFFLGMIVAALVLFRSMLQAPALGRPVAVIAVAYVAIAFAFIATGSPALEAAAVLAIILWALIVAIRLLRIPVRSGRPGARPHDASTSSSDPLPHA